MTTLLTIFALLVAIVAVGVVAVVWVIRSLVVGVSRKRREPTLPAAPLLPDDRLAIVTEHIARFARSGFISAETCAKMMAAIDAERFPVAPNRQIHRVEPPPLPTAPLPVLPLELEPDGMAVAPGSTATAIEDVIGHEPVPGPIDSPIELSLPAKARPRSPRRSFAQLLAAFMEESNIRWGELVGGMLIVGCSVALVVSFWAGITQRPWLEFSVFTAVTAVFFGLGLYSEHRWRLPNTSRGMLVIATLLAPLNFLAFAALSSGNAPALGNVGPQILALALFAYLLWEAGRVIAPTWPALLTVGVTVASGCLLFLGGVDLRSQSGETVAALAAMPVAAYIALTAIMLWQARGWKHLHMYGANAIFLLLGVLTFGTALALGLLLHRVGISVAVARLALPLSLGGLPMLGTGLFVFRRTTGRRLALFGTAGAAVGALGASILLAGIAFAWPDPVGMISIVIGDFIALTAIAIIFDIPAAHWLALPCAALAWWLAFHLMRGDVSRAAKALNMMRAFLDPLNGTALVPLVVLLAAARILWMRLGRRADAITYGMIAVAIAVGSTILVGWSGVGRSPDAYCCTLVFGAYAIGSFAIAWFERRAPFAWTGWLFTAAAWVQGFIAFRLTENPLADGLVVVALFATISYWFARKRPDAAAALLLVRPARFVAIGSIVLALVAAVMSLSHCDAARVAADVFGAGAVLLAIAALDEFVPLFIGGQIATACAAGLAVFSRLSVEKWFIHSPAAFLEPWTIQAEAIAMAGICVIWKLPRIIVARRSDRMPPGGALSSMRKVLSSAAIFDRWLSVGMLAVLSGLIFAVVVPAISIEIFHANPGSVAAFDLRQIGPGSWVLLVILINLFALDRRAAHSDFSRVALMLTVWMICPLLAGRVCMSAQSATALRWLCAAFLLAGVAVVSAIDRLRLRRIESAQVHGAALQRDDTAYFAILGLGIGPILFLSISATLMALSDDRYAGSSPGTFFSRIGPGFSQAIPLLIAATVLFIDAVRRRSHRFALAGVANLCLTGTLGYSLHLATLSRSLDAGDFIRLTQMNAMILAAFGGAWLAMWKRFRPPEIGDGIVPPWLRRVVWISLLLNAIVIIPGAIGLALFPDSVTALLAPAGNVWGWASLLLVSAVSIAMAAMEHNRLTVRNLGLAGLGLAAMLGFSAVGLLSMTSWDAFHFMLAGDVLAAWGLLALGVQVVRRGESGSILRDASSVASGDQGGGPAVLNYQSGGEVGTPLPVYFGGEPAQPAFVRWVSIIGGLAVALALRASVGDPVAPWWSMGAALAVSLLFLTVACWSTRRGFVYFAGVLLNFAAAAWFVHRGAAAGLSAIDFISMQIVVAAVPGIAWLVLELQVFRRRGRTLLKIQAFHHVVAVVATALAVGEVIVIVLPRMGGMALSHHPLMMLLALASCAALLIACLRDNEARYALPGLYLLGLAAVAFGAQSFGIPSHWLPWTLVAAQGVFALLAAMIFPRLVRVGQADVTSSSAGESIAAQSWLSGANGLIASAVVVAATIADFSLNPAAARIMMASAAISQSFSLALLSRGLRSAWSRAASILVFVGAVILWIWAWLPVERAGLLDRAVIGLCTASAFAFAAEYLVSRWMDVKNPWRQAASDAARPLIAVAIVGLIATVFAEIGIAPAAHVLPLHVISACVLATLLCGCAFALRSAIAPRRGQSLTDRQRSGCIYAAQALLAVALLHLRLMEPQLFGGILTPWWPLVAMAVAFVGVGCAEILRRRGISAALFQPVERTGIFLPFLPLIGWWVGPTTQVDFGPLLLTVGAFYAMVAGLKRSFGFAAVAALACNAALWTALSQIHSLAFTSHPQIWLIPVSLCGLAGAQVNRGKLTPEQRTAIRYFCLAPIYVSSTADVFLNGVQYAPWLPFILAGISIAGVMMGVFLRIRPFLFLGTGFLFLSILTMIAFASLQLHWTWLWYVAGICLGSGILALFALFEKRRQSILMALEGLRRWE